MPHRRRESLSAVASSPTRQAPIGVALRRSFAAGYGGEALRADLLAGAVVGVVALPLSMALAVAVGVPPQHGLYTAIIAGAIGALAGGSKFQVTGPTAAFVVVLAPIVQQHGLGGLLTAGFLAGILLVAMGVARLGRLVHFIPYPVTTGFTAGIATVIATLQLKDALGLTIHEMPEAFPRKVLALWGARGTISLLEAAVTVVTLALLLAMPRVLRRIPAPLVALGGVGLATWLFDLPVATIGTRFHTVVDGREIAGIPSVLPEPSWPWAPGGLSWSSLQALAPAAFAIAMLGAIESLLSAVVADGMTGKRHDPDAELVGQGLANVAGSLFGGIAATGALARTATNVRSGARSPISALVHSLVVLLSVVLLAPLVAYVPMAGLAALLLLVAWNMSEMRHVRRIIEAGPRSDVFVLATCYGLTVLFDMVVAVSVGIVLASLLFMRRMAELTHSQVFDDSDETETDRAVPRGVVVYEISGALFFGASQNAMSALSAIRSDARVVVLGLGRVPVIDASGLVALESALDQLQRRGLFVIIAGPLPEPRRVFARSELEVRLDHVLFARDLDEGLRIADDLIRLNADWAEAAAPSELPLEP
jgi:sulfate permease, SulP family